MNTCPITYLPCEATYSEKGLKQISPKLTNLNPLDYTAEDLRYEASVRASKISIQGVQPKLSAVISLKEEKFNIVDIHGKYILKPQHHIFKQVPENEDLSMKLAALSGIEVPLHGLVYSKDGSLTYFIKRFDRLGRNKKVAVEDFAQLAGLSRETKYNYTIEKLIGLVDTYCTFPVIEKAKLYNRIIFNFLIGNEDMHLKNYSIIIKESKAELSPGYDFLNTTILLKGDIEETALKLKGKNKNMNRELLVDYLGAERMNLASKIIDNILSNFSFRKTDYEKMIGASFLSDKNKEKYKLLIDRRFSVLYL